MLMKTSRVTPNGVFASSALFAFSVAIAGCQTTSARPPSPEERAVQEFEGSIPRDARPTGHARSFTLTAAPTTLTLLDGRSLDVWAYNGSVPGPTLRVRKGDRVRVEFHNRLPQPTTVHWHGVRLPNAMDGVPGVTQPPVPPGGDFVYEFVPKDAGTFWFHPHVRGSEQVERGLHGVLIVEDEAPPPFDEELVWVLDDWRLDAQGAVDPAFNTRHDLAHDGRWGRDVTVNGRTGTRVFTRPGSRLRVRILNAANGRVFRLGLGGLPARLLAVDGTYTSRPTPAEGFELAPGNRVDLDVTVPADAAGRLYTVTDTFIARMPNALVSIDVAAEPARPTPGFAAPRARVPRWAEGLSLPIRQTYRLDARTGGPFGIEWTFNDEAFRHDEDGAGGHEHHPTATLPLGRWSRLRFVNDSYRLHPIHLHGMFFRVIGRDGAFVDEPFLRDTALVHPRETVDIALVPLDAGRWMMHCHILEHAESGMMTLLDVVPPRAVAAAAHHP
jgi:FtsP/CotA-like multicopper oxidase with cupredoxin domain